MNPVADVLSGAACAMSGMAWQHLALALLHTLWQGLAAAAILWFLLRRISAERPEVRYWTAFSALLFVLFAGLTTWAVLDLDLTSDLAQAATGVASPALAAAAPPSSLIAAESVAMAQRVGHESSNTHANAQRKTLHDRPPETGRAWLALVAAAWLLGVVLMTGRMAWLVVRLRRVTRGPDISDDRLWLWTNEIRHLLHITRALRIVEVAEEFGPAVLGVVRPVLALPIAMMTGLPPDAVRAILAHELAHVRRYDYLFNLMQMVIEAVLFFNPAVWWINRQIRIEREACCDAMAARVLGEPLTLANALSLWAERTYARNVAGIASKETAKDASTSVSYPATAFANDNGEGPRLLLDRVRRIVVPGYRPQMVVSPLGFVGWLLGGLLCLATLSCGTSAVVELAAKALTPAERMERIVETQKEYAPEATEGALKNGVVTLSGTLRNEDGKPLPKNISFAVNSYTDNRGQGSHGGQNIGLTNRFSLEVPTGKTWLICGGVDGYAPALIGPITGKAGETISDIDMVFRHGIVQTVRVIDAKGESVADAAINMWLSVEERAIGSCSYTTDAKGAFVLRLPTEKQQCELRIHKPGFQPLIRRGVAIQATKELTITLASAERLRGIVLSPDGKPVAEVEIHECIKEKKRGDTSISGENGRVLATTDAKGRFALDELEDDAAYLMVAQSSEYGRCPFVIEVPGNNELSLQYGPPLIVSGLLKGVPNSTDEPPWVTYSQAYAPTNGKATYAPYFTTRFTGTVPVTWKDGEGRFSILGLLPGDVFLRAGDHSLKTTLKPLATPQDVTMDLTQPAVLPSMRQVVLRFTTADGAVQPLGTVRVLVRESGPDPKSEHKAVPIENGVARFYAFVAGGIYCEAIGMLGYCFEPVRAQVEPGEVPLEIAVPVTPAGAIAGQVLKTDGTPSMTSTSISVKGVLATKQATRTGDFAANITTDDQGKFFVTPLQLGGTYTVVATHGMTIQLSEPIQLDATRPTANMSLRFPGTTVAEGTVLAPNGHPAIDVSFGLVFYSTPWNAVTSWYVQGVGPDGRFHFEHLSLGVGQYALVFTPKTDYRPCRVPLPLDGKPVTVQLQCGLVLEGQVIDDATGNPATNISVTAWPDRLQEGDIACQSQLQTDEQGRFRFSNLEDRAYRIENRSGGRWVGPGHQVWRPGQTDVVLHVNSNETSQ